MSTTLNNCKLICPVCNYLMSTYEDQFSMKEYNCCHDCFLKWAESRKEDWLAGWRPSDDSIKIHIVHKERIILR